MNSTTPSMKWRTIPPLIQDDNHQRWRKLKEFSKFHIKQIVDDQILQGKIDREKWGANLHKYVLKAVDSVKPSSRYLDDGMDFNKFVDIFCFNDFLDI